MHVGTMGLAMLSHETGNAIDIYRQCHLAIHFRNFWWIKLVTNGFEAGALAGSGVLV